MPARVRPPASFCQSYRARGTSQGSSQVVGGNAFEPGDPALGSAVMRVGVLNVPGPRMHAHARAQVHRLVLHTQLFGGCGHGRRTVGARDGVALDVGPECSAQTGLGSRVDHEVSRRPRPVSGHQNRNQPMPRSLRGARPPRWRGLWLAAWALAFVRAHEKGLVGFDHARQIARLGTSGHDAVSWPVPPSCARWCRLHRGLAGYAGVSTLWVSARWFLECANVLQSAQKRQRIHSMRRAAVAAKLAKLPVRVNQKLADAITLDRLAAPLGLSVCGAAYSDPTCTSARTGCFSCQRPTMLYMPFYW
jgi:hypothetical protein